MATSTALHGLHNVIKKRLISNTSDRECDLAIDDQLDRRLEVLKENFENVWTGWRNCDECMLSWVEEFENFSPLLSKILAQLEILCSKYDGREISEHPEIVNLYKDVLAKRGRKLYKFINTMNDAIAECEAEVSKDSEYTNELYKNANKKCSNEYHSVEKMILSFPKGRFQFADSLKKTGWSIKWWSNENGGRDQKRSEAAVGR